MSLVCAAGSLGLLLPMLDLKPPGISHMGLGTSKQQCHVIRFTGLKASFPNNRNID